MRTILICGLLVFCALGSEEVFAQISQIDSDEFGHTLIDTIQISLETAEPIDRIIQVMRQLESQIEAEQKAEDVKQQKAQDLCDKDLAQLEVENALIQRRLVEIQSILDELRPQVSVRQGVQAAKLKWKQSLEQKIAEADALRQAERNEYAQRAKDHEYAQYVIETVRRMFADDTTTTAFLQTNKHGAEPGTVSEVVKRLQGFVDESEQLKKSYRQMFTLLAQITTAMQAGADPETLNKVVSLCESMLETIEQSASTDRQADQKREQNYQMEHALYAKDMTKLENQLAYLEAEIAQISERVRANEQDKSDFLTRQGQKQKQSEDRNTECTESAYLYKQARDKRSGNRELVSKIIGLFTVNQRDFATYVKNRTAAGDFD